MSRMLFVVPLLGALLFSAPPAATKKSFLDKPTMEAYVRHLFVFGPAIKVEIENPKPSTTLPGFLDVTVRASMGQQSQEFPFIVSKDGEKIVQGNVYDVNQNPFKPELDKLVTQSEPSFGTPAATVVLVEFSDFECPFCKEEAQMLRTNLLSAYPKQVRLYFKDYPLEQIHPWAKMAAMTGRCIFRLNAGAFWEYHDWIYASQADITKDNFKSKVLDWAKTKNLDTLQLGRCIDSHATEADVNRTLAEGRALNVSSTPTLFVNGRRLVGRLDWTSLRNVIDYEIDYQKTAKNAGEDCGCDIKLPGLTGNN